MSSAGWALSDDLGTAAIVTTCMVASIAALYVLLELRARPKGGLQVAVSGLLGIALFAAALLRPVHVTVRGAVVGPPVAVLVDRSRRLLIPTSDGTRWSRAVSAVKSLSRHFSDARISVMAFGEGSVAPLDLGAAVSRSADSDLGAALASLSAASGERPRVAVVMSDGRLTSPSIEGATREALGRLGIPIHTVRLEDKTLPDASIRNVRAAGAAVAHQALALSIEVGCAGGLTCHSIPVTVKELKSGVDPVVLATGDAKIEDGVGRMELEITLDRAGSRVVEVSIQAPSGDELPQNDSRLLTFAVARDRVRLLHLAGRPTYDVRALRRWLKSDEAVDVVAFFILREGAKGEDDPNADDRDLALIEFPVNELFTTHLPSFDAVILQDIDAVRYKLDQYLGRLAHYVQSGGGLIMVGGPSSFSGGNYARTPIDSVLPVEQVETGDYDPASFVPRYTEAGRVAPMTRALMDLVGEELPTMHGVNLLGAPRPGSIVLWEHPRLRAGAAPMPVLALGEAGDGRAIALAVDDTHQLAFSEFAEKAAGRGYGALWDGLVGWLMRDPRFEAARIELADPCIAGEPALLRVTRLPGMEGEVEAWLEPLGTPSRTRIQLTAGPTKASVTEIPIPKLEPGGYTARVRIGAAPPSGHDFACERAGPSWGDSRPDPERLWKIAQVTSGQSVRFDAIDSLPIPPSTEIAAERHVTPVLPPWAWALSASVLLGVHWVSRRRSGLS